MVERRKAVAGRSSCNEKEKTVKKRVKSGGTTRKDNRRRLSGYERFAYERQSRASVELKR